MLVRILQASVTTWKRRKIRENTRETENPACGVQVLETVRSTFEATVGGKQACDVAYLKTPGVTLSFRRLLETWVCNKPRRRRRKPGVNSLQPPQTRGRQKGPATPSPSRGAGSRLHLVFPLPRFSLPAPGWERPPGPPESLVVFLCFSRELSTNIPPSP